MVERQRACHSIWRLSCVARSLTADDVGGFTEQGFPGRPHRRTDQASQHFPGWCCGWMVAYVHANHTAISSNLPILENPYSRTICALRDPQSYLPIMVQDPARRQVNPVSTRLRH